VPRILLVDDDLNDCLIVRHILRGDFELSEAHSIKEAQSEIEANPPECVLVDLKLPDGSGTSFVQSLRFNNPEIAIVVLTGSLNPKEIGESRLAGANFILMKTPELESKEYVVQSVNDAIRQNFIWNRRLKSA
jgi:CheY-like chemotaxis protein